MKKLISFASLALFTIALFSCNKTVDVVDPGVKMATINAQIYPNVNQPYDAVLGSSAVFSIGEKVVVYIPYQIANDEINDADLIIRDDQGELVYRTPLLQTGDPVAEGLTVPDELVGTQFMYGTIEVDNAFANKNFVLSIEVRGINSGYSEDKIENAFSVLP